MRTIFICRMVVFCLLLPAASFRLIAQQQIIVSECNLQGWVKQNTAGNKLEFSHGPAPVPAGKGSLYFESPTGSFVRFRNTAYHQTPLSAITAFSYDSYIQNRSNSRDAPYIVLQVDINGDNTIDDNLLFNPWYQVPSFTGPGFPDQGPTQTGIWQSWDLLQGAWWQGPPPLPDPDNGGELFSLATYISRNPQARIMNGSGTGAATGGIRLTAGAAPGIFGTGFRGYADRFIIGINGQVKMYDFEFSIADAGPDLQTIFGDGSNCILLNGSGNGGVPPYAYSWSPGGSNPVSSSTTVCPTATTNYTLTVTDNNGCTGTDQVTVEVNDIRCGIKLDKVTLCHHNETICVAAAAVPAHLAHGDQLGVCPDQLRVYTRSTVIPAGTGEDQGFTLFPNPLKVQGQLQFSLSSDALVHISLYDNMGKKIRDVMRGFRSAGRQQVILDRTGLSQGLYYIRLEITSGEGMFQQTKKLLISR